MFGQPALGAALALAHYMSGLGVGVIYRFYGSRREKPPREPAKVRNLWNRAMEQLYRARLEDGRSMGRIVNESISESVATLFMIMSFIVLFSVLLRVLQAMGVMAVVATPLVAVYHLLGLSSNLVGPTLQGLFEIDIGTAAAASAHAPLVQALMVVSGIIAWSGLSVHGQVASVLTGTDISMKPYFVARLLQAILAALLTVVFVRPVTAVMGGVGLPAFASRDWLMSGPPVATMVDGVHYAILVAGMSLVALALGAMVVGGVRLFRIIWFRVALH